MTTATDDMTAIETETAPERHWFRSDYRRAAAFLRTARHVRCEPHSPAPAAKQAAVDHMAALLAAVFEADSAAAESHPFIPAKFSASTQLAQAEPGGYDAEDDAEDDGDEAGEE